MAEYWPPSAEALKQQEKAGRRASSGGENSDVAAMTKTASWMVSAAELKRQENAAKAGGKVGDDSSKKPTPDQALSRHRDNVNFLYKLIQDGQRETKTEWGPLWPNSCRWLLSGKTKLFVLTPTHDAEERAAALGGRKGKLAHFGIDHAVPSVSDYNHAQQTDRTNIGVYDESSGGFRTRDGKIAIADPVSFRDYASADAYLRQLKLSIIHEVQHDADHLSGGVFERYTSEFNAYWVSNMFALDSPKSGTADPSLAAHDGTVIDGFDNARQQSIFLYMYNSSLYPFVSVGMRWSSFKSHVLALKSPTGINVRNSPEIDDLYLALTKRPFDSAAAKATLTTLNTGDRTAIAARGMRTAWASVIAELPDADRSYFAEKLNVPSALTKTDRPLSRFFDGAGKQLDNASISTATGVADWFR